MELPDPLFCLAAFGEVLANNGFVTNNVLFGGRFLAGIWPQRSRVAQLPQLTEDCRLSLSHFC